MRILAGIVVAVPLFAVAACSASGNAAAPATRTAIVHNTTTQTTTATATVTAHPVITKIIATHTRTARVTYPPPPPKSYGDRTYVVGTDIKPGICRTKGADICYWARLASLSTEDIIDNANTTGPATIQVHGSDRALQIQGDCTFSRI